LAAAIHAMALKGSDEAKDELRRAAKQYSVEGWTAAQIAKAGAVGAVTGLPGGPLGLALEGLDIAYLLAAAGRGCYGVGHIKGRDVDYEWDLSLILAIWCGAAEACGAIAAGKVGIKVAGKAAVGIGANVAGALAGKLAAKSAMKFGSKAGAKVVALASTKLAAKVLAKASVKWVPLLGGSRGPGSTSGSWAASWARPTATTPGTTWSWATTWRRQSNRGEAADG
jgi:hypothetical protein